MTFDQKLEALDKAGIQGVAVVRFTHDLSRWEPETFVKTVLVDWLRVAEVWVGADFLFGRDRSGNFSLLRALGAQHGFRTEKIDPVRYKDFVVSSTRIRRLVAEGRVDEAGALLGHHFYIDGTVVTRRGTRSRNRRAHGQPRDNERTDPAARRLCDDDGHRRHRASEHHQRRHSGRQWMPRAEPSIETHLLDGDRDLYGRTVRLAFVQRLRDERRFPDVDALKAQIDADVRRARRLFDRLSV